MCRVLARDDNGAGRGGERVELNTQNLHLPAPHGPSLLEFLSSFIILIKFNMKIKIRILFLIFR